MIPEAIASRPAGATIDVVMPQLGESVDRGTISRWLKALGDPVAVDEPLFEVSSDKVTMEIPALCAGQLSEIMVPEGGEVPVRSVVARIAVAGQRRAATESGKRVGRDAFSPVVRRLAREHQIDLSRVTGSAHSGRITKGDILAYVASAANAAATAVATPPLPAQPPPAPQDRTNTASPSSNGRRESLSPAQRTAIARLTAAQKSAVNVFSVIEIDMEGVAAARKARGLTYLPFIARAVIHALHEYPLLNTTLDENDGALVYHEAVHLGIAVDLDGAGLVVPVVRDAQALNVDGLALAIARLAGAARARTLRPDAYSGSTFTLTNNGAFGSLMTAPVINPPNVAIASTDAVEERPVVIDRMIAIRRRMYFCMTWDHRAFDGSTAARFLTSVKRALETWDWNTQ